MLSTLRLQVFDKITQLLLAWAIGGSRYQSTTNVKADITLQIAKTSGDNIQNKSPQTHAR